MRLALIAVLAAGCFVSRRSTELECSVDANCAPDRMCERGYCVEREVDASLCPAVCPGCDPVTKQCPIQCATANACRDVACPEGYDCTITCSHANACDDIDCTRARSCTVSCTVTDGCEDVMCGAGPCNVRCSANQACSRVACASSCKCDVACTGTSCDDTSCPMGSVALCTVDGTANSSCTSATQPGCSDCP